MTPTLRPLSQYTNKLRQELQSLKVDTQSLDLLSSAARRDLEALQSSGLQRIHYPDFLVQVSGGHLSRASSAGGDGTKGPTEELGVHLALSQLWLFHISWGLFLWRCPQIMCPWACPPATTPVTREWTTSPPTQQHVLLFMVLNPLLPRTQWEVASSLVTPEGALFVLVVSISLGKCLKYFTVPGKTHCD